MTTSDPVNEEPANSGDGKPLARAALQIQRIEPSYRQVARQLREQILEGVLKQGTQLPNESDLSRLFGVSRSTVREALRTLASEQLIVTTRGTTGGSFVAKPEIEHVISYLETSIGLLSDSQLIRVQDMLEAKAVLEVPAARLAAVRRTDEDILELERALKVERATPDQVRMAGGHIGHHQIVHLAILKAARNPMLTMMTRPTFMAFRSRFLERQGTQAFWHRVDDDHKRIVQAIKDGDAQLAETSMREHLDTLRDLYLVEPSATS